MKLSNKYVQADGCKIIPNEIYNYYKSYFDEIFTSVPEFSITKEYIDDNNYSYLFNENELRFHREFYCPSNLKNVEKDRLIKKYFPDIDTDLFQIGISEYQCLEFIESENLVKIIVAPIGWGKTSLIRHTYIYLINQSKYLKNRVIPRYISVDKNANIFVGLKDVMEIKHRLYEYFIIPILKTPCLHFTGINNDQFWEFLKKCPEFFDLASQENNLNYIYTDKNNENYKQEIRQLREKAQEKNVFFLLAMKYLSEEKHRIPLLLLDDIDLFPSIVQTTIFSESIYLSSIYGIKVVMSLRKNTYDRFVDDFQTNYATYSDLIRNPILLDRRSIRAYLEKRLNAIFGKISKNEYNYRFLEKIHNIWITQKEGDQIINSMAEFLLHDEHQNYLDNISYHNFRRINQFLEIYFSSGYLNTASFYEAIIKGQFDNTGKKTDLSILLSSTITGNYLTHFSDREYHEIPTIVWSILNLFCNMKGKNGIKLTYNPYFIRNHLLNFAIRHRTFTKRELYNTYLQIFTNRCSCKKESINRALCRLLQCDLFESPESYKIDEDNINDINEISITSSGEYYHYVFRGYFEYLVYMKDDVDFQNIKVNIKDSIEVKERAYRYKEVEKFLTFLYKEEKEMLGNLSKVQRKIFCNNFSNPNNSANPLTTYFSVEEMIKFGKERSYNNRGFKKLLREMTLFIKDY